MIAKEFWVGLGITAAFLGMTLPATAQMCTPLRVVDGKGTRVDKEVSAPGTVVTGNNWNTDFAVPSNADYRQYIARIVPKNGGTYDIEMNLKYSNDTTDQVYKQTSFALKENSPFSVSGAPRVNSDPYQINVVVGGVAVLGNRYSLSVLGCR